MKKRIIGARASSILFNFLVANKEKIKKPFLLPANVCPIVPVTFLKANVPFIFSDITDDNMLIDKQDAINKVLEGQISGLLFVRSYGYFEDEKDFFSQIKEINRNLFIIDDRCLCIPDVDGKDVYEEADLTLFSTGYAKFVEMNYGGFAFINEDIPYKNYKINFNPKDHERLVTSMNYSVKNNVKFSYDFDEWLNNTVDFNEKEYFDLILKNIEKTLKQKEILNRVYYKMLPKTIQIGHITENWRFSILVDNKDDILNKIFEAGLFASSHYSSVSHLFSNTKSPKAEFIHNKIINLFNDFRFDEQKAQHTCKIINENLK